MCNVFKTLLSTILVLIISSFITQIDDTFIMTKCVKAAVAVKDEATGCSHRFSWATTKTVTCTTAGEKVYKCTKCGYIKNRQKVLPTGHPGYTQPTCTKNSVCIRCGYVVKKATGHKFQKATCTTPKKCVTCGIVIGQATDHNLKAQMKDDKTHILTCSFCDYEKEEPHILDKICECGFKRVVVGKCTTKKLAQNHDIVKQYGKAYKTEHEIKLHCNDCNIDVKQKNEAHKYDANGKCLCGKRICTSTKLIETHNKIKISTKKLNASDAEYKTKHVIVKTCQECRVAVQEYVKHEFNENGKCKCGYKDTNKARCTVNKIVKSHDVEKLELTKMDKNYHSFVYLCKECNVKSKLTKEKHKFDAVGNCACGYIDINKASCTEEKFIEGHKLNVKYDKTKVTLNNHMKIITCAKCKISKEEEEKHEFNSKGICICKYKDMSKIKCTESKMINEHLPVKVELKDDRTTKTQHIYRLYCKTCNVKSNVKSERHICDSDGFCECGYVDYSKVEKGYTIQKNNKVSYAERIDPDSKVILIAFGGDGEREAGLKNGGDNFVVNDPRVTDACNYAYMTKPSDGWRKNKENVVDTSVDYILKATGCSSLEEVKEQGYVVVLYGFSSGGEMLNPVWDELHNNGLTPTTEMLVEGYVRDTVTDEQIVDHANAGTNVQIYSVTNGSKDSISDRTNQAGERLDGSGSNGTINHTEYVPEEGFKKDNYTHGQAGRQSADSVAEVIQELGDMATA